MQRAGATARMPATDMVRVASRSAGMAWHAVTCEPFLWPRDQVALCRYVRHPPDRPTGLCALDDSALEILIGWLDDSHLYALTCVCKHLWKHRLAAAAPRACTEPRMHPLVTVALRSERDARHLRRRSRARLVAHKLQYLLWLERDLRAIDYDPSWQRMLADDVLRGPRLIPADLVWEAVHVAIGRLFPVQTWSWRTLVDAPVDPLVGWHAVRAAGLLWQVIQVAAVRLSSDEVRRLLRAAVQRETEWWEHVMALDEEADPYTALRLSEIKMVVVAWYDGELVRPVL